MASAFAGSMALTGIGGVISAISTIAGGSAANASAQYTATQLRQNASTEIGAAQRGALDDKLKASMVASEATARAAASGVNAGFGSPVTNVGEIAKRGEYNSLMSLWKGENAATGDLNKAKAVEYEGEAAEDASYLNAASTIAAAGGSMFKTYGVSQFQNPGGRPDVKL